MYPPLYGFILRAAIALFGGAEWALRLPSALAGIAAIPLIHLVAGKASDIDAMRAFVRDRRPAAVWYLCTDPYPKNAFVDYLNAEFNVVGIQQYLRATVMLLVPK